MSGVHTSSRHMVRRYNQEKRYISNRYASDEKDCFSSIFILEIEPGTCKLWHWVMSIVAGKEWLSSDTKLRPGRDAARPIW